VLVYSVRPIASASNGKLIKAGNGLWRVELPAGQRNVNLVLRRDAP